MTRPTVVPLAVGVLAAAILLGAGLLAPIEARHSAPFGFRLTYDASRGIAVGGATVEPNYPNFDRIDLDLRAYAVAATYDLTVHVRPDRPGAADARTLTLSVPGAEIAHDKPAFADPFVTLRFPPIADSAGQRYYVWVDRGPRNRDDVLALWSIKSYSRTTGAHVLAAFLRPPSGGGRGSLATAGLVGLLLGLVVAFGWLMAALTDLARRRSVLAPRPTGSVAVAERGWYTVDSLARRPRRRVVTFWRRRSPGPTTGAPPPSKDSRDARQERD